VREDGVRKSEIRNPQSEVDRNLMTFVSSFPGFRLRLTRWGIAYLVASIVLGMAAVNTGNNALMALLGLALGSYVVSGAWSRQVLAAVEATVDVPSEVYAGRPALIGVELANRSGFFPAYGLVIRDDAGSSVLREHFLATGQRRRHSVEVVFPRRGWQEIGPWRLEVFLPLGFFLKSKTLVTGRQVLVYPRLLHASMASTRRGGGRRSPDALESRGREGDVTQLRDYRDGDEVRAMHWKQTARQQHPVVVERQRTTERPVFFVVDPRLEDPTDPQQLERFEHLLSEVATGIVRRLREGIRVGLVVGPLVVAPVRGVRRAPTLLRPLAEVEPTSKAAEAPVAVNGGRAMTFVVPGAMSR
jgi:uncharacterized protein (DUF58 family)